MRGAVKTLAELRREGGVAAVRAAIVRELSRGTPSEAARALGCSWSSLWRSAKRCGVPWPKGEAVAGR